MSEFPGPARKRKADEPIRQITIHPVLDRAYVCAEHPEGQLEWLGDALGSDFMVVRFVDGWARLHTGDGRSNEDWFGWRADVLAPIEGVVVVVRAPGRTNEPGSHFGGPAGGIILQDDDGVFVTVAHVDDISVEQGDRVRAGQVVGKVGNNGTSWVPHLHVGAWIGETPLQIRVDLAALGRLVEQVGEEPYYGLTSERTV